MEKSMEKAQSRVAEIPLSELETILEQHDTMKEEIAWLKQNLFQCEGKWNKIVKNTIRENVNLKEENRILREQLSRVKESNETRSTEGGEGRKRPF